MRDKYVWLSRCFVVLGVVAAPLYLVESSDVQSILSTVIVALLLPAVWIGWRKHGLPIGFVATLGAIGVLYVGWAIAGQFAEGDSASIIATLLDVAANTMIVIAMAFVVSKRRGRFTSGDLLDGVIIGLGGWLVAWITLVQPYTQLGEQPPLGLIPNALYLPMAAPLIALAAALAFSATRDRPAPLLLVAGVLANLAGDALYALFEVGHMGEGAVTIADALYIPAFAWSAACFVHPSVTELVSAPRDYKRLQLPGRLALTGLSLTVPILLMALVPAGSTSDRIVRAVSAMAILLLVSVRMATAARSHFDAQTSLIEAARMDSLTGLPNRTAMLQLTQESIDASWAGGTRPAVFLIDIDRFKNTNDSLGHAAGDEAIRVIAARLVIVAKELDLTVGRPAGDEFVVLDTASPTTGDALARAEALLEVFKTPVSLDAGVMFMTASVGVATMPTGRDVEPSDLFRYADIAMYRAKDAGRNCLALYHDSMQERLTHRMAIETALHSALDNRELRLFHQPIVDTATGRVSGFEALMRWQRSDGTLMSPAEFIPVAEETGIITSIGSWALLQAMTQLRTWIDDGVVTDDCSVSVNVSPRQLADPAFCDVVEEALARAKLRPGQLWLEVTESMMIDNPELARTTLERVHATGVGIALDDFGTGFSSLSLLQQFPIQRIKIDRAFVDGVATNPNDRALVRTIIAMGRSLDMDIVAEGVETVEQLKMLRELGCDRAQGFLISHPVPIDAMRSTIAALERLSRWEPFDDVLGDRPDRPTRIT